MNETLSQSERKRAAIVQAAIEQFRAHGFQGASMDAIAAAAEVSKRTVYNHFPSKDELFAEILLQLWQRSAALDRPEYDAERPLHEQLVGLLRAKLRLICDPGFVDLARVAMAEAMHSPERAQHMVARLGEKEQGLAAWIRAAQSDGRLRKVDPAYAAHQLQGLLKAFAFWPQLSMGQKALSRTEGERLLEDCAAMFLRYYEA